MERRKKKEDCCGCGACADACRAGAIRMVMDGEGFYYPKVDESACVNCGRCGSVCPVKNAGCMGENHNLYLGVQARDEAVRRHSSSGGVFPMLAQYVLARRGVVYGAGYDDDMNVIHKEASGLPQLEQIKRTKYVQSDMGGIYRSVERRLQEDRWVLFCGTPCQAHALKLFLGMPYEKLVVVDLVCYGVPSPDVWRDYMKLLEKKHKGKVTAFSFRDKRNRDNGHTRSYVANGKEYVDSIYQDLFCRLYFSDWILRPSCHHCKFCTVDRDSDFTIGDFFGLGRVRPDREDGLGTSMVVVRTETAKRIWEEIKEDAVWFACAREELLQPRLLEPVKRPAGRRLFMLLRNVLPLSFFRYVLDIRRKLK